MQSVISAEKLDHTRRTHGVKDVLDKKIRKEYHYISKLVYQKGRTMKDVRGVLTERIKRTDIVESFRFNLQEKVDFLPGQFLHVIFDEHNRGNRELNKYLSLLSAPGRDYIEVTKKISGSEFSKRLMDLQQGDTVLLKLPMGNCVFKKEYRKIAFLIGGIGITPVISIVEYIMDKALPTDVHLLYCNKDEDSVAFRQELDAWQEKNKLFKVTYIFTEQKSKDPAYLFGNIDKNMLSAQIRDYQERIIFIFGSPVMVVAMKNVCFDAGCSAEQVKTEYFTGY